MAEVHNIDMYARHIESGEIYKIICVTNRNPNNPNFIKTVVYMDRDHGSWSRPFDEFMKKFEGVDPKNSIMEVM